MQQQAPRLRDSDARERGRAGAWSLCHSSFCNLILDFRVFFVQLTLGLAAYGREGDDEDTELAVAVPRFLA